MSFILDALKKLEQEKAARKNGNINISEEILRVNHQTRQKTKRAVPVSVVLVGFGLTLMLLLGVTGVFLWRSHDAADDSNAVAKREEKTSLAAERVQKDSARIEVAKTSGTPEATPVPITPESSPPPAEAARIPQQPDAPLRRPSNSGFRDESAPSYREASGSGGSGLLVSGIAWQDEPQARRAVVNGTLVSEGAQVGGATVDEILPTRVRFSSGGRRFTVSISGTLVGK
jgi:general secretion pathway protein B